MTVQVKICGINDATAFDAAIAAGADWVGFNFFPPSPRYITPAGAKGLSARSPGGPQRVGLFVDPTPEAIAATLDTVRLDILQLYGAFDLSRLRNRFGLLVWRAVGVESAADLPAAAHGADRLVVEAKPPRGATRPGGNAARFDWSLLRGWRAPAPWILAGGLTVKNVTEAIRVTGTSAVDVSSGVERAPGVKDPVLISVFIANARSNGIRFRRAIPTDAEALGQSHVAAWREAYTGLIPDEVLRSLDPRQRAAMWRDALAQGIVVHLAERDNTIVGFGACGPQRDPTLPQAGEIHAVYVLQSAQRQGVGRSLMAALARDLLAQGNCSAALWVMEGNTPARRFYERLGGREIARREQQREGFSAIGIAYGWGDLNSLI
jgi:phosphoribosylanthranilate isomerase